MDKKIFETEYHNKPFVYNGKELVGLSRIEICNNCEAENVDGHILEDGQELCVYCSVCDFSQGKDIIMRSIMAAFNVLEMRMGINSNT